MILSSHALARLILDAHFPDPVTALAVLLAESGGNSTARNTSVAGNVDRGLWQISSKWHPEVSDTEAFDPTQATQAAYRISKGGTDWTPWAAYQHNTHLYFADKAEEWVKEARQEKLWPSK